MSGHFSSIKSISKPIFLGILCVSFVFLTVSPSTALEINQNSQPKISEINHDIESPKVNDSVQFTVLLENIGSEEVTNVTLNINQRDQTKRMKMFSFDNITYDLSYSFNSSGTVRYQAFLFIDGNLSDSSPMNMFQVDGIPNDKTILVQYNHSHQLTKGNFSIITADSNLNLTLEIDEPIALSIANLTKSELNLPGNVIPVSNAYGIQINNSNAIINSNLQMRFEKTLIDDLGINPQLLNLYTRENTTWESVEIEINEDTQQISHQAKHFSEWVVTASIPTLKFIETQVDYSTSQGEYLDLPVILKNFGSYAAENISIRIIEPPGLFLNNISNIIGIDKIDPLEEQKFLWQFLVDATGEFNIVVLCGSDNADGDVLNIRIIVTTTSDGITSTTSSQTTIFRPIQVTIVMISISVYYKRQKHACFE